METIDGYHWLRYHEASKMLGIKPSEVRRLMLIGMLEKEMDRQIPSYQSQITSEVQA